jgi:hypothetical protein
MTTDSNTDAAREKRIGFNVRIERQFDPDFDPPCPRRVIGGGLAWYVAQSPASAPEQASVAIGRLDDGWKRFHEDHRAQTG